MAQRQNSKVCTAQDMLRSSYVQNQLTPDLPSIQVGYPVDNSYVNQAAGSRKRKYYEDTKTIPF